MKKSKGQKKGEFSPDYDWSKICLELKNDIHVDLNPDPQKDADFIQNVFRYVMFLSLINDEEISSPGFCPFDYRQESPSPEELHEIEEFKPGFRMINYMDSLLHIADATNLEIRGPALYRILLSPTQETRIRVYSRLIIFNYFRSMLIENYVAVSEKAKEIQRRQEELANKLRQIEERIEELSDIPDQYNDVLLQQQEALQRLSAIGDTHDAADEQADKDDISRVQRKIELLKEKIREVEQRKFDAEQIANYDPSTADRQIEQLEQRIKTMRSSVHSLSQEEENLHDEGIKLEQARESLISKTELIQDLQNRQAANNELRELQAKVDAVKQQIKQKDASVAALQDKLNKKLTSKRTEADERRRLNSKITDLEREIEDIADDHHRDMATVMNHIQQIRSDSVAFLESLPI